MKRVNFAAAVLCEQASLGSNGFLCRELKLEIVALDSATLDGSSNELNEFRSLFVRLLESQLAWQAGTESALESAGIDVQSSHDCEYCSCRFYYL